MRPHYLNSLFKPRSIAVFGASDRTGSVGQVVFKNLLESGYEGQLFAINTGHDEVQGHKAWNNLDDFSDQIDLAIVATPAKTVPAIIESCGEHGIKAAIIMSSGFREVGPKGQRLENKVLNIANAYGVRVLGPNCLGLMRADQKLNATFGNGMVKPGNLALVSQSGAICTTIVDWAAESEIGFSTIVSMGISADLDFGDILDYLVNDPKTHSILLYIEGLHNARRFMSGLRAAARIKPIIAIKVGRHRLGENASMSHTGALVGNDKVFSAALARAGVVRIRAINQLCAAAEVLASRYKGCGERLAIISNGGGPGVLAADHAADLQLKLATLHEDSSKHLNSKLRATWSRGNPLDIIGDATPENYREAIATCLKDSGVDGLLVILTPQAMTDPLQVAEIVCELANDHKKPILTSWMGGKQVREARHLLRKSGIPTYATPESAVDAYHFLAAYQQNQTLLLQTPAKLGGPIKKPNSEAAKLIIESALANKRKMLTEPESIAILQAYNIPTVKNGIAHSAEEALIVATSIGFPVAMKICSPDIIHKSDAGGVRLNISTPEDVRNTFRDLIRCTNELRPHARIDGVIVEEMHNSPTGRELLVGIKHDKIFGPIITFGFGGTAVEVIDDTAVSLAPLNVCLAENLIDNTRAGKMLGHFRHLPPINREALIDVLLSVSTMACELPHITDMDINPLIADEHGVISVDSRIHVNYATVSKNCYHHMAIHPYPSRLMHSAQLPDGTNITIRPIRPEDAQIETEFINSLSEESRYFRFMHNLHELTQTMLVRFTQIDYDQEMALIAVTEEEGKEIELGVTRYVINPDLVSCEFALVVSDQKQGQGLGHLLMHHLMDTAKERGLEIMNGEVLSNNSKMLGLMRSVGFMINDNPDDINIKDVTKRL